MTPRRPRPAFILAVAVALLTAAGVVGVVKHQRRHGATNQTVANSLKIDLVGNFWFDSPPGVMGVTGLVGLEVTAPMTLLDVRPYRVTSGVEVISRAYFYGSGTSPSGHRLFNGAPGGTCFSGPWPPTGYGPSFPVPGLRLAAGDPVLIGYFVRAPAVLGTHVVTGYRIRYRTPNGHVHVVTGDRVHFQMNFRTPPTVGRSPCDVPVPTALVEPNPGYPT